MRPPLLIRFVRGPSFYEVLPAREGPGFIGLRDGRIVVRGADQASVAKFLVEVGDACH